MQTKTEMAAIVVAGIALCGALYFSPWLWRQRRMGLLRRRVAERRVLALTYDDGPSEFTPQILDLLKRHGARATFFMQGQQAERYPEIADRVVEEGHEVGCHSFRHLNAWKVAPGNAVQDIEKGYEQLSPWMKPEGKFRPPFGKMTLPTYFAIRRRGASTWWWTIDSGDTDRVLPGSSRLTESLRGEKGGIVLLHDLDRGPERNRFVLEATESLLAMAARESIRSVTLGEIEMAR